MQFQRPTREDDQEFLIRLYFGAGSDYLAMCIKRAYLDFSRTMHGVSNIGGDDARYDYASKVVRERFEMGLNKLGGNPSQTRFDQWHRDACNQLKAIYAQHGYPAFHFGQAQKWLNMTLKYIYVMGDRRLPGYERFYEFGHSPLDNIIIDTFKKYNPPRLTCAWSRLDNYEEYFGYQKWIRTTFPDSSPLAVEFRLWLDETHSV